MITERPANTRNWIQSASITARKEQQQSSYVKWIQISLRRQHLVDLPFLLDERFLNESHAAPSGAHGKEISSILRTLLPRDSFDSLYEDADLLRR